MSRVADIIAMSLLLCATAIAQPPDPVTNAQNATTVRPEDPKWQVLCDEMVHYVSVAKNTDRIVRNRMIVPLFNGIENTALAPQSRPEMRDPNEWYRLLSAGKPVPKPQSQLERSALHRALRQAVPPGPFPAIVLPPPDWKRLCADMARLVSTPELNIKMRMQVNMELSAMGLAPRTDRPEIDDFDEWQSLLLSGQPVPKPQTRLEQMALMDALRPPSQQQAIRQQRVSEQRRALRNLWNGRMDVVRYAGHVAAITLLTMI